MERGTLTIGASTTPGIYVLPGVLGAFRQRYPGIEVTLQLGNSEQIEALVRAGELDLGVVGDSGTSPAEASLAARVADELCWSSVRRMRGPDAATSVPPSWRTSRS